MCQPPLRGNAHATRTLIKEHICELILIVYPCGMWICLLSKLFLGSSSCCTDKKQGNNLQRVITNNSWYENNNYMSGFKATPCELIRIREWRYRNKLVHYNKKNKNKKTKHQRSKTKSILAVNSSSSKGNNCCFYSLLIINWKRHDAIYSVGTEPASM